MRPKGALRVLVNNIKIISVNLHRRATSPGGGAGRRDLDHVSVAAGVAFAPGRLAIALPVQEQGAKNTLFFASGRNSSLDCPNVA